MLEPACIYTYMFRTSVGLLSLVDILYFYLLSTSVRSWKRHRTTTTKNGEFWSNAPAASDCCVQMIGSLRLRPARKATLMRTLL